jgi:hypothetical protein
VSGTTNVALQMPYLVSAALTGLGLVVVGVAMIAIGVKRHDSDQRIRKLEQLAAMLRDPDGDAEADGLSTEAAPRRASARELLTYPAFRAAAIFTAVAIAGLVVMAVTWWGVSGTLDVSNQVAYTVSGGLGGLALAVAGSGLLFAHVTRWAAAREDGSLDGLIGAMATAAQGQKKQPRGRRA